MPSLRSQFARSSAHRRSRTTWSAINPDDVHSHDISGLCGIWGYVEFDPIIRVEIGASGDAGVMDKVHGACGIFLTEPPALPFYGDSSLHYLFSIPVR